jgi:hypothetical protein
MPHAFGKSITFSFTPIIDSEPTAVDALVSARLFSEKPSELQISNPATPGFIDEQTSWASGGNYEKLITFDPVTDPDPNSNEDLEKYYVVVNFKYEAAGPTVYKNEAIFLFRPDGLTSRIECDAEDIFDIEESLEDLFSIYQVDRRIENAKKDLFRWYKALGYPPKSLFRLEELNDACRYRATALCCISLYNDRAQHWKEKFSVYQEQYEQALKSSQPGVDQDGDDDPDALETTPPSGAFYVTR